MMTDTPLKANDTAAPQPPAAKKAPKVDVLHGERRLDDFYWLREKTNPRSSVTSRPRTPTPLHS